MLMLACFITWYFMFSISMFQSKNERAASVCYVSVGINIVLFIMTMFKDPGVKRSVYEHHIKIMDAINRDEEAEEAGQHSSSTTAADTAMDVEEEDADLESGSTESSLKQRKNKG